MFLKNEMKVKIFANNNDHWKLVLKALLKGITLML